MNYKTYGTALALSILLATTVTPAFAQDTTGANAERAEEIADEREDDDGFDWGLLGLLGLLGLIPRKRHTTVHHDTDRVGPTGTMGR